MKRLIIISFILYFVTGFNLLHAQNSRQNDGQFDKFRSEKVSFLTDKLQLTPTEAQKFWPLFNELEKKRWEAQNMRRELEFKVQFAEAPLSKKEVIQLTRDFSGSMQKEAELYVKYNEEFLKIITPEKVLLLYKSENEFRMHLLRKYRGNVR
jgi:Spy/CpxP family protein refolding chaperone